MNTGFVSGETFGRPLEFRHGFSGLVRRSGPEGFRLDGSDLVFRDHPQTLAVSPSEADWMDFWDAARQVGALYMRTFRGDALVQDALGVITYVVAPSRSGAPDLVLDWRGAVAFDHYSANSPLFGDETPVQAALNESIAKGPHVSAILSSSHICDNSLYGLNPLISRFHTLLVDFVRSLGPIEYCD